MKSVLVLGGGFAGVEAAIALRKAGLAVTLVSDRPYLFLYPTSIWIPTGRMPFERACLDLPDLSARHGFRFVQGGVEAISGARREAVVNGTVFSADALIIGIGGGRVQSRGSEHVQTICGDPASTQRFRDALLRLLARGSGRIAVGFGGNPNDPSAVRGGPGFEMIFNLDHELRRRGVRRNFELTFFAPMPVPGARMGKKAVAAAGSMFTRLGIASRFGKKISGFDAGGVLFEDQSRIDADLVMFISGVDGHPVVKTSDLPRNAAGFVKINSGCEVEGLEGVYAIGDVAALEGPDWRAKQGHVAEVMARVAVSNLLSRFAGRNAGASYTPHLNILCIMDTGNGAAFVFRNDRHEVMIPLPWIGHWLKKLWGWYYAATKKRLIPRLPGF